MKFDLRQRLLATTLFASVTLVAQPVLAQSTAPVSPDVPREATDVQTDSAAAVPDSQADAGDEIVVTGTLIRNPNITASAPVTVIGEAELELRQSNVAEEVLREIPGVVPSVGSQVNNGNGGASFVNLRGIGTNRNLVLLDGKRVVPAGLGGVVDLNNIPLALLERTDVLTGGASTTYGADAVSGVVNFVTKRDFAGIDLSLSQQISERGDGNVFRADLLVGANLDDGRGNVALAIGYQQADPVFQGDRDISVFNISSATGLPSGSGASVPARIFIPGTGFRQLDGAGNFRPTAAFDSFNFNPFNVFQTPFERFNIFGQGSYEITDGIEVYSQGLFSKNTVSTIIAPSASFGSPLTFSIANPFLTDSTANRLCSANGGDAAQCAVARTAAPGSAGERLVSPPVLRRFVEGGGRVSEYTTTIFDVQAGIRGDVTENIGFDIFGSYGESENIQRQTNNGLLSRLSQAVDAVRDPASGAITCRNQANGCQPFNLFGPAGSISPQAFNFINASASGSTLTSLSQIRGVLSGDLDFISLRSPLADSAFGFALGGEYRRYTAASVSDVAQQTPSEVLGNGAASPDVFGAYDVYEGFAEVIAPLIVDRPFFHSLQLELGGRISDYSTTGTAYTYKVGGSWEPVASLKIRGGYNRATRSPNIGELFAPQVTQLDNLDVDPCQGNFPVTNAVLRGVCLAQGAPASTIGNIQEPNAGQINVTTGGNAALGVEKADTYTAGIVFQPVFIRGLTITADYYNIRVRDAITTPSSTDVLRSCFGPAPFTNPAAGAEGTVACQSIRRNPITGGIDGDVATTAGLPLFQSNLGTIKTSGIDLVATYRRDLGPVGLNLSFLGNWTNEAKFQANPVSTNVFGNVGPSECVGQYSVNCGSLQPEFSFSQRTTLTAGRTSVSVLWRFIDDMRIEGGPDLVVDGTEVNQFVRAFETIDEKHYFDLALRQEVTDDINLVFTVVNLFDNAPPLVGSTIGGTAFNSGNTFPSTYDPLGRRFRIGANLRF